MLNDLSTDNDPRVTGAHTGRKPEALASSSKMLDTYLTDIEQLLHYQLWAAALRDALAIPHIAVALSDAQRHSSAEQFKAWCGAWIRPSEIARTAAVDAERLYRMWRERAAPDEPETIGVPVQALKQLRLRRLARPMSPGCRPTQPRTTDSDAAQALEISSVLIDAARRWYIRQAARNRTVQSNLARLAVLR